MSEYKFLIVFQTGRLDDRKFSVEGEGGKSASCRWELGVLGGKAMQPFCSRERLADVEVMLTSTITANRKYSSRTPAAII